MLSSVAMMLSSSLVEANANISSTLREKHDLEQPPVTVEMTLQEPPRALYFLAAGTAAAVSCATFNPLDCLRVRWQVAPHSPAANKSLISYGWHICQTEGLLEGLWKPGLGANVTGMALSAAIRFGYYETVRDSLLEMSSSIDGAGDMDSKGKKKNGVHMVAAGIICGAVGYGVTTPFHLLKTMIQAEKSIIGPDGRYVSGSRIGKKPYATNFFTGVTRIVQDRGFVSLYKGAIPLMSRGALFTCGQMLGYDGLKTVAKQHRVLEDGPLLHVVSSVSASFGASFLSAPADFVMAKYMTDTSKRGLYSCIKNVYKHNGVKGFWRGWNIFFVRLTPVMLLYSTLYEQLRLELGLGYLT